MRNHDISYHQNGPFSMKGNLTRNDDLSKIRPNLLALLPDSERPAQTSSHPGEEFLYVLDGVIMLELDGVQEVMYPCDSAHFKSTIPHTFWNISKHMAHVFSAHLHIPTEPQTETSKLN